MTYDLIDPIFYAWAARHGLQVYTDCKDEEVRMVRMHGKGNEHSGIAISFHLKDDNGIFSATTDDRFWVNIGITRRPSPISEFEQLETTIETLDDVLEMAYARGLSWLAG